MVTNKAILGFFVVLIVVVLAIVLIRRNPNFMARFGRDTEDTTTNEEITPTETSENSTGTVGGAQSPQGLTACTAELKARCTASEAPVCGYERVENQDGRSERALTFKSACAYCSLYGTDDVLDLGDEKYYPLGYTTGACTAAK